MTSEEKRKPCKATMLSKIIPEHVHICSGSHDAEYHLCGDPKCRRFFYQKET